MKVKSIRIQNFRSFSDETIDLDDYNCVVGPNGAGKSTVLTALNVFFRNTEAPTEVATLGEEDFHKKNTSEPVRITVTFVDLSDEAKDDLKNYVRLDQLIVSSRAAWDETSGSARVEQVGTRLVVRAFTSFFEADARKARAPELKEIYGKVRAEHDELPAAGSKPAMLDAIRKYEEDHPEQCEPVESGDQFYGWSKGQNRLAKYIQWVYIPAVKDASSEQDESKATALGQLLERTIRAKVDFDGPISELKADLEERYKEMLAKNQSALDGIKEGIIKRLQEWAHPDAKVGLNWHYEQNKSVVINKPFARAHVGEGDFLGEVARVGHGLQRSFIVAVLQELASEGDDGAPTLLLGFEEPELYQHPPQARHLVDVLETVSQGNAQVIVTTHSPYFISGRGFEAIRMLRKEAGATTASAMKKEDLAEKLTAALKDKPCQPTATMAAVEQILQPSQAELFFTPLAVIVEGTEDVAYIATHMKLSGRWDEFRRIGGHFVTAGGKANMSRLVAIARGLRIPLFLVFDGDADKANKDQNTRDNACLLRLCDHDDAVSQPSEVLWSSSMVMWDTCIGKVVQGDLGMAAWEKAEESAKRKNDLTVGVDRKKSVLVVATLEELWGAGSKSDSLEQLCQAIVTCAGSPNSAPAGAEVQKVK